MNPAEHSLFDLYIGMFAARTDGFVVDSGMHRNEDLTPEVVVSAFKHGKSISGYTAKPDDEGVIRTQVGAIDFDGGTDEDVYAVRKLLGEHSIRTLRVASRRGQHLWVFIDHMSSRMGSEHTTYGQVPADTVHRALSHAVTLAAPDLAKSGKAEVFPKQTRGQWPGGTLRMPLMRHPKSGVVYPAYDEDGGQLNTIMDLITYGAGLTTDWGAINLFAGGAPLQYPKGLDLHAQPRKEYDGPSATQILATIGCKAEPGRATHCPFHDDKRKSLSVAADDARVWCKAPSCVANNEERGVGSMQLRQLVEDRR